MEQIIEKLAQLQETKDPFSDWTLDEKQKLLELYLLISKKESKIFKLIYSCQGDDCWEDIFRDYDRSYLECKKEGVQDAIDMIMEYKSRNKEKEKE